MDNILLPHDSVVGGLLGQVPDDPKGSLHAGPVPLRVDPPGDRLKSVVVVDEGPVSHLGLLVVVGQVSEAAEGGLEKLVVPAVDPDDLDELPDAVGVADGQLERLVVDGHVGDDAGGADDDRDLVVVQQVDQLVGELLWNDDEAVLVGCLD